ncbi:flagellar basal-body rod protein FlgF [Halomonas ventosae]|uniref:Flagellar basal-body rod protein FlgF n=1 Tax=Halomonas ventosae TaxID=229007 RepID=A0A4V3DQG9_9GAMM|nr:flagellar basal body rod protein FlgF [Halomonas ventosae]TDR56096.1 flagellar basal-body rod protein FlgF [Halomonas ventosae]
MDKILYTAMSGARQSMEQQAVVNHNLANATTSGFRAQLHAMRAVPVQGEARLDTRASVVASTPGSDLSAGPITATGRPLDVALEGAAWMAVQDAQGNEAYTRRGDIQIDGDGMLHVAGRPVLGADGPVLVPLESQVSIGADGTISAIAPGQTPDTIAEVGRIKLVTTDAQTLERGDDGLFRSRAGDGGMAALPRSETAKLATGSLEGSNVSAVESMVSMIDIARRYEMQMKVISSADENAQRANSLLSLQG